MHQPVVPSRLIDKPVHHAGLPEAPRRRQQNMTEAELFPNQIDERLASVAVRAPYRRSNKITWHATVMSHNKIVAQPLNWVHVVILAYAQASAPASCPTVWTIKAQVLESKPSDVRVMMGEWRDEPSSGSVAGEAGGCPPGDLRSGGGATSSRYGKSCCMWLQCRYVGGLKRGFGGQRGAGPDARCSVIAIRQMMLHLVAWRCIPAGEGGESEGGCGTETAGSYCWTAEKAEESVLRSMSDNSMRVSAGTHSIRTVRFVFNGLRGF